METEWAENRAKLPQDFIRKALGKVLDGLYSTGERDKFRTRIERTATGTEVFITHRGMIEVYEGNRSERTVWQARPVDPELETEFLRRLMVKLGAPAEQAKAAQATVVKAATLQLGTQNGQPVLTLEDSFERAWRRVGLSLDRTGFTVEDRDRAQGIYFVRYVAPVMDKTEPGFFSKLFSSKPKDRGPQKYRIVVKSAGGKTTLNVLGADGNAELTEDAQRILQVLADDLK
jgi:outer membrane protein assembly factor BamC